MNVGWKVTLTYKVCSRCLCKHNIGMIFNKCYNSLQQFSRDIFKGFQRKHEVSPFCRYCRRCFFIVHSWWKHLPHVRFLPSPHQVQDCLHHWTIRSSDCKLCFSFYLIKILKHYPRDSDHRFTGFRNHCLHH